METERKLHLKFIEVIDSFDKVRTQMNKLFSSGYPVMPDIQINISKAEIQGKSISTLLEELITIENVWNAQLF